MTAKEEKEKAKFVRESVVKYFFDMSKSTFTVMVLGGLAALFGIVEQKFEKVEGTLRDQITLHQGEPSGEDDTWIWHILEQVGLDSTFRQIPGA